MTRPIKFRAWEKRSLVMRLWDYLKGIDYSRQFALFDDPDFVWMQFTGLLDKNGKEIYEGDVVKNANGKTKIVSYSEEASFVFQDSQDETTYEALMELMTSNFRNKKDYDFEVIGNICENPELIKN